MASPVTLAGERLLVGAMSGTSADGVDVALCGIGGHGAAMTCRLLRHHHLAYDDRLRRAIATLRQIGSAPLADLARVGRDVSLAYARAVNELLAATGTSADDVAAVAAHGQTL